MDNKSDTPSLYLPAPSLSDKRSDTNSLAFDVIRRLPISSAAIHTQIEAHIHRDTHAHAKAVKPFHSDIIMLCDVAFWLTVL